jgi:hypothetical protein
MNADEILQALRNQRYRLDVETLDDDLCNAVELIEQLMREMATHRAGWMEVLTILGDAANG